MSWVNMGRNGEVPVIPANGFNWREIPAFNKKTAVEAKGQSYKRICEQLRTEHQYCSS